MSVRKKVALVALVLFFAFVSSLFFLLGCVEGDCKNGYGKFRAPSGSTYEGGWKSGKRHGTGKLEYGIFSEWAGDVYEGEWMDDKCNGMGKYTWPDGGVFQGFYKDNERLQGVHTYGPESEWAGDWYEGEYKGGEMHGTGTYYSAHDDIRYAGAFFNGLMHGNGRMSFGDGSKKPGHEIKGVWNHGVNQEFQNLLKNLQ